MTVSIETLLTILLIASALIGWFSAIKKIGASEMKTAKELEHLGNQVAILSARVEASEACGVQNDKTIAELKKDIEWIKDGIREIKKALNAGGE